MVASPPPDESAEPIHTSADPVAAAASSAHAAIAELATMTDPRAFESLLELSASVGVALGQSARALADASSWSQVADYSGTTKQAAWSRWRV